MSCQVIHVWYENASQPFERIIYKCTSPHSQPEQPLHCIFMIFSDTDALLAERERVCASVGCRDLRPSSRGGWQSAERANGWGCVAKCLISILLMFQAHALTAPWLDCNCLNSAPAAPSWQYNCHILTPASLDTATQPFGCLEGCYIWLHLGSICTYMVKGF